MGPLWRSLMKVRVMKNWWKRHWSSRKLRWDVDLRIRALKFQRVLSQMKWRGRAEKSVRKDQSRKSFNQNDTVFFFLPSGFYTVN